MRYALDFAPLRLRRRLVDLGEWLHGWCDLFDIVRGIGSLAVEPGGDKRSVLDVVEGARTILLLKAQDDAGAPVSGWRSDPGEDVGRVFADELEDVGIAIALDGVAAGGQALAVDGEAEGDVECFGLGEGGADSHGKGGQECRRQEEGAEFNRMCVASELRRRH